MPSDVECEGFNGTTHSISNSRASPSASRFLWENFQGRVGHGSGLEGLVISVREDNAESVDGTR